MQFARGIGRMQQNQTQLFKIQTQIRAELNNLRKTYHDASKTNVKTFEKRHYPQQLYKETLKSPYSALNPSAEPVQGVAGGAQNIMDRRIYNRTQNGMLKIDRGRRKISPIFLQNKRSVSPVQRRHYPSQYQDSIDLEFKRTRHPSAYLIRRQASTTPDKKQRSILSFVDDKQIQTHRPCKKIIPKKHQYAKQFF